MVRITKDSRITLIELPPTQFGELYGEVSYDIYSRVRLPSRGIHFIGGVLKRLGFNNVEYLNPKYHGHIRKNEDRIKESDVVGVSSITRTDKQTIKLLDLIRNGAVTVAGGFGPTFRAEEYSRYADYVVIGEGETTTEELFLSLAGSGVAVDEIKGLGFRRNGEYVFTGERDNLKPSELELVHPDYDKATLSQLSTVPIESSRGCPKNCNFCSVTGFYGRSYRTKSREWVVEELGRMNSYGKGIFFTDDNFTGKKSRCVALLEQIIESGLNKREGVAQVTINAASNDSLLDLMWNAGIRTLCIGIESINDETLEAYSKRVSAEQNKEAIKIFKERGFWVHGMMMPGGDGDTPESLRETSEWANKDLDSVQYFSPIPLPGTRMRSQLEEEGRILRDGEDDLWHLYDGDNVLIRPKNFTPLQLQKTIYKMYDSFYSWKKGLSKALKSRDFRAVKIALGLLAYTKLKGEKILYSPESKRHLEFLESVS